MCGFAGIIRFDGASPDPAALAAMSNHLAHRGPDGQGISVSGPCGLVHRRLSIIDLLSGQQPMTLPAGETQSRGEVLQHGSLRLVFNGEIYNHRALRKKLERRGHRFASDHSDTEALLYGYREYGPELPKHLHGMFAFAVYDDVNRRLFLCRDRVGKKPLYYRPTSQGQGLVFGSLVATLFTGNTPPPTLDESALRTYLELGYTFEKPLAAGVHELPPATSITFDAQGTPSETVYWRPPPISKHSTSLGAADALEEVVSDAVSARLEADVPLGCFLSGGIDSSLVAALAQRSLKQKGGPALRTFSVSMPDAAYDETVYAKQVADHLGTHHTVLQAQPDNAAADLEHLMAISGEPTADSSLLPTHWLCRAAREHCRAALSGDGGDELFGGYNRYRALRFLNSHAWWARHLPTFANAAPRSRRVAISRLVAAARAGRSPASRYRSMIHLFTHEQIQTLHPGLGEGQNDLPHFPGWPDVAHAAMRWDLHHYLPHVLLRKVDRAAMAVALEVRCPLLDTAVCDLAGHLPTSVLMPGNRPKGLLREVAARHLPHNIATRPKAGFAVPLTDWLRTTLRDPLHARLTDGRLSALGFSQPTLLTLFNEHQAATRNHSHRLFSLLQLSLWADWAQKGK
ncbi:MAG: asparagine synthase (glutamine-hydrolyzing) [Algisphaera sp.]